MKKRTLLAASFILALLFSVLAVSIHLGIAQAATDVSGIISSDTTWTKANSPYTLTGNALVTSGVTLTVEPGATVNLNGYYIRLNGTLRAKGSPVERISIFGGGIDFTGASSDWNEQTKSGCIIENAVINDSSISLSSASPKINRNSITATITANQGSPVISNNTITGGLFLSGGTCLISSNVINGIISFSLSGGPVILGNTITGGINTVWGSPQILNNTIIAAVDSAIFVGGGNPVISNNKITQNASVGISLSAGLTRSIDTVIAGNTISGCTKAGISVADFLDPEWGTSTALIERNSIVNNEIGIDSNGQGTVTIRNNTIAGSSVGIDGPSSTSAIIFNNFYDNGYNIYMRVPNDLNATYNWWRTVDTQAINQTIYDFKNDFNLGRVSFVPFLTVPNPQVSAAAIPTPTPTSSPSPSLSPSPSPSPATTPTPTPSPEPEPEPFPTIFVVVVTVATIAMVSVGLLVYFKKRKR